MVINCVSTSNVIMNLPPMPKPKAPKSPVGQDGKSTHSSASISHSEPKSQDRKSTQSSTSTLIGHSESTSPLGQDGKSTHSRASTYSPFTGTSITHSEPESFLKHIRLVPLDYAQERERIESERHIRLRQENEKRGSTSAGGKLSKDKWRFGSK